MMNVCRRNSGNTNKSAVMSEQMEQSLMGSKEQQYLSFVLKYAYECTLSKGKGKEVREQEGRVGAGDMGAACLLPEL